jgi:hypothetical protein
VTDIFCVAGGSSSDAALAAARVALLCAEDVHRLLDQLVRADAIPPSLEAHTGRFSRRLARVLGANPVEAEQEAPA